MAGLFDDLVPKGGLFDDLVPKKGVYGDTPKRGQSRSLKDEVQGAMTALNRSLLIGDEIMAASATAENVLTGKTKLQDVGSDFKRNMQTVRGIEEDFDKRRPIVADTMRGLGNSALLVVPGAKMTQGGSVLANAARGAVGASLAGEAYGLADAGTVKERLDRGAKNATNPLTLGLGAGAGALASRGPKKTAPKAKTDTDILKDIGVETTLPQRAGGSLKQIEDLAMRFPIVGQAISGVRNRQVEQLNRGVALTALRPIGVSLPADVKPGFDMVNYVDDAIGAVYDQAAKRTPRVRMDTQLNDELRDISLRQADLPEQVANQYNSIISGRLKRLQEGEVSGQTVKSIHSELGKLQSEAAKKGEQTLADMLGDARRSVIGLIERANPEARKLIRDADEAWVVYSIMNDAAAAASAKGGVFLPGQLNTQARSSAKRLGSNMAGKGKGALQDVATAASRTMSDQYGNPGTANALSLGAGGWGILTEPVTTLSAGAGLTAAATPYFLTARKVIETLPANPTPAQISRIEAQLAQLAKSDPAVVKLLEMVRARAGHAGALVASQPTPDGRSVLATGGR